jgi:glycosyltransferase involved in cell wall biosynthesis
MVYSNIFYIPKIKKVSGITTWLLEIAKKYKNIDITIMYKEESDREQINNLKKYVRVKKLKDEIIECNNLFITYHVKDTNQFNAKQIIGVVHTDYEINKLKPYGSKVDKVVAVSNKVADSYERISGIKPIVCYNPLTLEEHKKILKLLYMGRITEEKGKNRLKILLNEFDRNNIPYILTIIGDGELNINNNNIIYIKPRANASVFIPMYDYLIQLSNDDEAYSYTINEALINGVPIIATDMTILKELGIKNKEHGYILNFDMTEIPIKEIYEEIPKPKYTPPKDIWNELLDNTPNTYKPEELIPVRCIRAYKDMDIGEHIPLNKVIYVDKERADHLVKKELVEYEETTPDPNCKYSVSVIIPVWNQQYLITRTLDSIPTRNNVEIIVVDDKSTDNTYKVLMDYKKAHKDKNIRLLHNMENKGVGFTYNRGLDEATGDYIVRIDSDDYFYTNQFNKIVDKELDGTDMIYYNLEDNNGRILEVHQGNRKGRCGAVKFIRRAFIGNTRCPEIRTAEDKYFNDELLDKYPTEKFTNRIVYHYNYPRENSLTDLTKRGLL